MKNEAILFISHTANRTGAPIELLRFLGWMKPRSEREILILLQDGGELEGNFRRIGPVRVWRRPLESGNLWVRRILELIRWEGFSNRMRLWRIRRWVRRYRVKLVVANTSFVGESLSALHSLKCPGVCRIHEMEYALRNFRFPHGFRSFQETLGRCDRFIAVSGAVARNLRENHGVDASRLHIVHGSVSPVNRGQYLDQRRIVELKARLKIPESAPVIGGAGSIQWGKGTDLFVQLAARMRQQYARAECHFLWVGGSLENQRFRQLAFDVARMKLGKFVHFVGHHADPFPYYALMDILAMLSREDSFPLVNMEVGLLGKPVLCFRGSGGSEEWVEDGCGEALPYMDIQGVACRIADLIEDRCLLEEMGQACRNKAEGLLVENNAPRLNRLLERVISGKGGDIDE